MAKARPHMTAADTAAPVSNLPVKLPAPANKGAGHARNPGFDLNLEWLEGVEVNFSAVERRTATLLGRRTVKKQWQAAWLLKALTCIDLTTLNGDDTPGRAIVDIFRIENGKVVEHWDVIQDIPAQPAYQNGMF